VRVDLDGLSLSLPLVAGEHDRQQPAVTATKSQPFSVENSTSAPGSLIASPTMRSLKAIR
jgi:hypothetical protein